jgi:hypothetical protein
MGLHNGKVLSQNLAERLPRLVRFFEQAALLSLRPIQGTKRWSLQVEQQL